MTTNNIIPSIPVSQGLQPQSTALTAKADAWRKAFEKEQAGILNHTRSIKFGSSAPASDSVHRDSQAASEQPRLPNMPEQRNSAPNPPTAQANRTEPANHRLANTSFGAIGSRMESLATQAPMVFQPEQQNLLQQLTRPTPGSGEMTSAIAMFESHYKQKWPLKNVYVAHSDDGVNVWIRDSAISSESNEASQLMQRIKLALQADGKALASLVLNGRTISG